MGNQSLDNKEMLESSDNFEMAYEAHSPAIYRFLYWRTQNVQLSQDLTSSVFEKAWRSRHSFQGGSIQAWLYRIARNVLIDYWRKYKVISLEETDDVVDENTVTVAERIDHNFASYRLHQALAKLPDDMYAVVRLRFIEGLSSKQVARRLQLSEGNVRVLQYRALKKLRGYLQ